MTSEACVKEAAAKMAKECPLASRSSYEFFILFWHTSAFENPKLKLCKVMKCGKKICVARKASNKKLNSVLTDVLTKDQTSWH